MYHPHKHSCHQDEILVSCQTDHSSRTMSWTDQQKKCTLCCRRHFSASLQSWVPQATMSCILTKSQDIQSISVELTVYCQVTNLNKHLKFVTDWSGTSHTERECKCLHHVMSLAASQSQCSFKPNSRKVDLMIWNHWLQGPMRSSQTSHCWYL